MNRDLRAEMIKAGAIVPDAGLYGSIVTEASAKSAGLTGVVE